MQTEFYQDGSPCQCDRMERLYYDSGELQQETPIVNGVPYGKQAFYEPYEMFNGEAKGTDYEEWVCKFETPYDNGIKHGLGFGYFHSGIVAVENKFELDAWVFQKEFYPSGKIHIEGPIHNDKKNGLERIYRESGELAEEIPYVDDKIHGIRVIHHGKKPYSKGCLLDDNLLDHPIGPSGSTTKISYANGIREGLETTHSEDGTLLYQCEWMNGKRRGKTKAYFSDGTQYRVSECLCDTDDLHVEIHSYPLGITSMETFSCDLENDRTNIGSVTVSKEHGTVNKRYEFSLQGTKYAEEVITDESGRIISRTPFRNGLRNGNARQYHPSGEVELQTPWKNGKVHGQEIEFYLDGKMRRTSMYSYGSKNGLERRFDEHGNVVMETLYKHGCACGDQLTLL